MSVVVVILVNRRTDVFSHLCPTCDAPVHMEQLLALVLFFGLTQCLAAEKAEFPLLMPDVQPLQVGSDHQSATTDLIVHISP